MRALIGRLYHFGLISGVMHTLVHELRVALSDCETVLDVGCGPSSPIQHCPRIDYSVGVEAFGPYLEASRERGIHTEYVQKRIEELNFPDNSFDAVILIEVLEHLSPSLGLDILRKAERWARKKVVVSSPNGFIPQKEVDGNPLQRHLSGWDYRAMRGLGFTCRGLAGLKYLRHEVENETMGDDLMTSIRFRPKPLWFAVAALSQIWTYRAPQFAFGLFSVKRLC